MSVTVVHVGDMLGNKTEILCGVHTVLGKTDRRH